MHQIERLNKILREHGREIRFSDNSLRDYRSFKKDQRRDIIALIYKQAVEKNLLLKPEGHGEPLHSPLTNFAKIKPKQIGIRIIYRPRLLADGTIRLEVIAIGPRDGKEVYEMAAKRIVSFLSEMEK